MIVSGRVNAVLDFLLLIIAVTVVVVIIAIIYQFVLVPSLKPLRCPVCGSTSIEKTPKRWVTSPGESTDIGPITLTSHYKYKCHVCQNEWEDY
jgi:transposase-like protein